MSILSTIKNNPQWKTWAIENTTESRASLLAALNEKTVQRTNENDVGFRGITNIYGAEFSATILTKLEAAMSGNALLKATYNAITTTGIDFSNAVTQGQITALQQAGVFTSEEATKLKEIGIWNIGTAKSVTGADATGELVAGWCAGVQREVLHEENDELLQDMRNIHQLAKAKIDSGIITDSTQLQNEWA